MTSLAAAAIGAGIGLGLLLLVEGAQGRQLLPRPDRQGAGTSLGGLLLRLTLGLVGGVLVLVTTGWPVAGLTVAVLLAMLPRFFGGDRRRHRAVIERTEAIASWTEMIRDNLAGAAGLEQALLATAPLAPVAIAEEVARFEARLERHVPLVESLSALGDDLDHPSADLVVVAIAKASRMEVRELGPLLTRLAQSIREDVRMRLRVEVSRARIRQSSRIVVSFTLAFIVMLFVFARNLLRPYDTVSGQLWMTVVVAVFVAAGVLINRYSQLATPVRFALRRRSAPVRGAEL